MYITVAIILLHQTDGKKVFADEFWTRTNLNSNYITSIETTPMGLLVGEFDSRIWLNPFNGIYLSSDLGETWTQISLSNRGVKDIAWSDNKIYAATYYFVDGSSGFFVSSDEGTRWEHTGNNFSASTVAASGSTIYLGTYDHGLWVSQDEGETWVQKLGDGVFGPTVTKIRSEGTIAVATLINSTFISNDGGQTWREADDLKGSNFDQISISADTILVGGRNVNGLYRSNDYGYTWSFVQNWGDYPSGAITNYNNHFYAGKQCDVTCIYQSDDGITWTTYASNVSQNRGLIADIVWLFASPAKLFALIPYDGVFKTDLDNTTNSNPIFALPWASKSNNELTDRITAYFDHEYPLLGYNYYSEPAYSAGTTVNFLGNRQKIPDLYYTSHNGTDFRLDYDTPVLAAASGYAQYYYCGGCGNTIKIDHQNTYQSIYMHLQSTDLVTGAEEVWVNAGDMIGRVGLTGNTTGPHLHFEIKKDINEDGDFTDETPQNNVDPFGWQSETTNDPWKGYSWNDTLGEHIGYKSVYLWNILPGSFKQTSLITTVGGVVEKDNKKITFNSGEENETVFLTNYKSPYIPKEQNNLGYINNTSFFIEAFNYLKQKVKLFTRPVTIDIRVNFELLKDIKPQSVKIYYWDEETLTWKPITTILDIEHNKVTGQTNHFSNFAVFGEKLDPLQTVTISNSTFVTR